jgi:hypothetical protein
MKKNKSSNYTFTINNYTKNMLNQFEHVAKSLEKHKYILYSLEIAPKTKIKHIQGYIELNESQRFTFLHNYFNLKKKKKIDKFHIEPAKGTQKQNLEYISKDGEYFEYGEPKKKGTREDLINLKTKLKENPKSIKKLMEDDVTNSQQMRFLEGMQKYLFPERDVNVPPVVFWIYGKTNLGKTKLVYDSFESICSVSDYKWPGTGYMQQDCFLLDDFRKEDIAFHTLLKITDRYPFTLAVKGSSIALNSPYIVITTTHSVSITYRGFYEDIKQLQRRVVEIDLKSEKIENLKNYKKLESF